jgi:MATE family multidrug resistance protein
MAIAMTMILFLFQGAIIRCFTDLPEVIAHCEIYMKWLFLFPVIMGVGLVYYGLYTGASYTPPVRNSMLIALLAFMIVYFAAIPVWHNHGLWLAFIVFCFFRSAVLFFSKNRLIQSAFPSVDKHRMSDPARLKAGA